MRPHRPMVPTWALVSAAFLVCYLVLFVFQVFLNEARAMPFPRYVPNIDPIGVDLRQMLAYSRSWMNGDTPYIGANLYPPLATVFFAPLTMLSENVAFALVTIATVACFLAASIGAPFLMCRRPNLAGLMSVAMLGLLSYGLQFEIERGQFNVIAYALALVGICLFHSHARIPRIVPYALFVLAVQIKVYPVIFMLAFIRSSDRWSHTLLRWALLSAVNIACLFALGFTVFTQFLTAIWKQMVNPYCWIGNHSLKSFTWHIGNTRLAESSVAVGLGLTVALLSVFALMLWLIVRQPHKTNFSYFVLSATCMALLLPSVSNDYKLPLLAVAFSLFIAGRPGRESCKTADVPRLTLFLGLATCIFATFFSYAYKPGAIYILKNNCLPILAVAVIAPLLSVADRRRQERESNKRIEATK